jgi:predicted pyridoxine 5'-phosphate oxidase superfamily flavin-nucleotide-binding protein
VNRREAIAALVSLPATAHVSVAQLKPTDVIVIECNDVITVAMAEQIKASVSAVWPHNRCAVLGGGLHLKIARSDESSG